MNFHQFIPGAKKKYAHAGNVNTVILCKGCGLAENEGRHGDPDPRVRAFFPTTRQLTGLPHFHRAYVYDLEIGKVVKACEHNHRGQKYAKRCADKMLKQVRREAKS